MIININDYVGRYISQHGYWATEDIDLIKMLIDFQLKKFETIVFYDVGANIGTHTLAIAKVYSDRVKIRAFEAQRQIYNMLCGTMAINGITNAYLYNNAVSNTDNDTIEIALPDYNSVNNFAGLELIPPKLSDNQDLVKTSTEQIKTICIDSFDERVDFIKIDIEGMEDKALMGATKTIEAHRPICFIELLKTDRDFVMDYFKKLNYVGFIGSIDLIAIPIEYQLQINGLQKVL